MNYSPRIIQGGMGVGVSDWRLARAVSTMGQLGVVSGTGIDVVMVRRLQSGDPDGNVRRALAHFPDERVADHIRDTYFVPGGKKPDAPYRSVTMYTIDPPAQRQQLTVAANFVEVFLAKEGHSFPVGINFLEKIQLPMLPSLYGAMLAGVDYVFVGAGIPRDIPELLDRLSRHESVSLRLHVENARPEDDFRFEFQPSKMTRNLPVLRRPKFMPIVASATLATALAKKSSGAVDGFVVEGSAAGGHIAPPRGPMQLNDRGEPRYGDKDLLDIEKMKALGLPFWLAGSYGSPDKLKEALELGANGVQVGTAFALCEESGIDRKIKNTLLDMIRKGTADVFTSPQASPAGFPFKMVNLPGSVYEEETYFSRPRLCDLGYLRHLYRRDDGTVGYRCPAEPVETFVKKGGDATEAAQRRCLCNGLTANIGLGQRHLDGYEEASLITAGDDLRGVTRFLRPDASSYTAADVVKTLLCGDTES